MAQNVQISKTPKTNNTRVDFQGDKFDDLIWKKGYEVTIEKAIKCPCRSKGGHQQSSCRNCGGSGWVFLNPTEDRMIMYSMNLNTKYREWSEESMGQVQISAMSRTELTFMDKITIKNARNIFNENVYPEYDQDKSKLFSFLTYNVEEIQYVGMYVSAEAKLQVLNKGDDFEIDNGNVLIFNEDILTNGGEKPTISVRYKHMTQYHILDVNREFMSSFVFQDGKEEAITLPISAVGQRAHFKLDKDTYRNDYLLDNYTDKYLQVEQRKT